MNMNAKILSILLIWSINSCHGKVELIEEPTSTFGLENQKILLKCRFRGDENSTVNWFFGESEIRQDQPENTVTSSGQTDGSFLSTLNFHLLSSNQGRYFCNASDASGWLTSKKAVVRIAFLNEQFISEPQDKTASVGETVLLECIPPVGLPAPTVKWRKDNLTLSLDERMQLSESGSLRIDRISWKDNGVYRCIAESFAFRRQSTQAHLTVRHRPYFVESPLSQSVHIHSSFELGCRAAGEPLPVILWRREPPFLDIPFERTRLLLKGSLQFTQVRLEDAGDYVCRAISSAGVIEAIAHVTVVSPPGLIETPPSRISVLEGERIELPCSAIGSPVPDVRWIRADPLAYYIADASTSSDGVVVTPSGSLVIFSARPEDTSSYECRASSPAGLTRSLTHLEVKPNPYLNPARFGALSTDRVSVTRTVPPSPVRLICQFPKILNASGFRPQIRHDAGRMALDGSGLSIVWRINGESLHSRFGTSNETFVETDGSLLIRHARERDEGNYTCVIFNHMSRRYTTWTIQLTVSRRAQQRQSVANKPADVKNLPAPVANLTLIGMGDTWLAFQWTDPDTDMEFNGYKVFYLPVVQGRSDIVSSNSRSYPSPISMKREDVDVAPTFDKWSFTPDWLRQHQVRLTNLSPNTGYWVEVCKVSRSGTSRGEMYPRIVYTLKNPFQVLIPSTVRPNTSNSKNVYNPLAPFISGVTAMDFQDLSSNFLAIAFNDVNVRSLTATEVLIHWTTSSSNNVLQQIDGFQIDIKPVPMSRCLVTATSDSLSQLSSFPYIGQADLISADRGNSKRSFMSPVHCSLSSDELLEQILRASSSMSITNTDDASNSIDPIGAAHQGKRSIVINRSVSSANPTTRTVGGDLSPFTCYEVALKAFKDDLTYGRIWSGASRPELALTLDSSPSHAPQLVSVEWLPNTIMDSVSKNRTLVAQVPDMSSSVVHLKWMPLELRKSHGALTGYVVHFLANMSDQSLSVKMPADVDSRDIFGLSPHAEYHVYLAAITCRGEGVRGPGYNLRPIIHMYDELSISANPSDDEDSWKFPFWAYGIICLVVVLWVLFAILIPLLNRRQSSKRSNTSTTDGTSYNYHDKANRPTTIRTGWFWCIFCNPMRAYRAGYPITVTTNGDVAVGGGETQPNGALTPDIRRDRVELTNHMAYTSDLTQRTSSASEHWIDRRPMGDRSTSGSNSQADHSMRQLPLYPPGLERSNHQMHSLGVGDEAEVYANSDHSALSDPNSPNGPHRSLLANPGADTRMSQPQLPDSINIPFPTPPTYHAYYHHHHQHSRTEPQAMDMLTNASIAHDRLVSPGPVRYPTSVGLSGDAAVPPYASCSVIPEHQARYAHPDAQPRSYSSAVPTCQVMDVFANPNGPPMLMFQSVVGVPPAPVPGEMAIMQDAMHQGSLPPMNSTSGESHWSPLQPPAAQPLLGHPNAMHHIPPPPTYPPPPIPMTNQWLCSRPSQLLPGQEPGFSTPSVDHQHHYYPAHSQPYPYRNAGSATPAYLCQPPIDDRAQPTRSASTLRSGRRLGPAGSRNGDGTSSGSSDRSSSGLGSEGQTRFGQLRHQPDMMVNGSGSDSSGSGLRPGMTQFHSGVTRLSRTPLQLPPNPTAAASAVKSTRSTSRPSDEARLDHPIVYSNNNNGNLTPRLPSVLAPPRMGHEMGNSRHTSGCSSYQPSGSSSSRGVLGDVDSRRLLLSPPMTMIVCNPSEVDRAASSSSIDMAL